MGKENIKGFMQEKMMQKKAMQEKMAQNLIGGMEKDAMEEMREKNWKEELQDEKKEEKKELLRTGSFLGLILLVSAYLGFSIENNQDAVVELLPWFGLVLAGYLLTGIFIIWVYTRPKRRKWRVSEYVRGVAGFYWTDMLIIAVFLGVQVVVPERYHFALVMNAVVLVAAWILNYTATVKLSKELNKHIWQKERVLLWDLDECPKNREAFFIQIENYAERNHMSLNYLEKNNPAIVELDQKPYLVTVEQSYHRFGPLYSLKFKELFEERE